jgi:ubiquitin-protein ligase
MSQSKLNKALYTNITYLKLCSKSDAPVKFLLDKSPFKDDNDDGEMNAAAKAEEHLIIGRIFPKSEIYNQGAYQIEMKLADTFPLQPPEVRFLTPIYHPNVDKDGK